MPLNEIDDLFEGAASVKSRFPSFYLHFYVDFLSYSFVVYSEGGGKGARRLICDVFNDTWRRSISFFKK